MYRYYSVPLWSWLFQLAWACEDRSRPRWKHVMFECAFRKQARQTLSKVFGEDDPVLPQYRATFTQQVTVSPGDDDMHEEQPVQVQVVVSARTAREAEAAVRKDYEFFLHCDRASRITDFKIKCIKGPR